jgi:hypothetical protein
MTYDDEEREDNELFGLRFKATKAEQRAIWVKLAQSAQSREWGFVRNLMNMVQHHTVTPKIHELALRMESADTAMTMFTSKLIEDMIAKREHL